MGGEGARVARGGLGREEIVLRKLKLVRTFV